MSGWQILDIQVRFGGQGNSPLNNILQFSDVARETDN